MPSKPRVVVVDDCPFFRRIIKSCMTSMGWEAVSMESGYELVKYYMRDGTPFDLHVLDIDMPVLDGIETARSIDLVIGEDAFIIFLSNSGGQFQHNRRRAFIEKPVDFSLFFHLVKKIESGCGFQEAAA